MPKSTVNMPHWVPLVLRLAAVYNLLWGTFVVVFPKTAFERLGLEAPNYPCIIQCLGMVIGVYGIGYWIAARDAATHWPIVLVGLLGKVFGPIGFVYNAWQGALPWIMGATILTNDILWWIPFAAILVHAARIHETRRTSVEGLTSYPMVRICLICRSNPHCCSSVFVTLAVRTVARHFLIFPDRRNRFIEPV